MTQADIQTVSIRSGATAEIQEEIIRVAQHSYTRLPLFEGLMERVAQSLGPALRAALNVQVEVALRSVRYMACADALAAAPNPGLVALAHASPWDGSLVVTLDPDLLFAALEIMLGASDRSDNRQDDGPKSAWSPRAFTTIEKRLGAQLVGLALREVAAAFAPLEKVTFTAGAIESGPRDIVFTPATAGSVQVTLSIMLEGRGGNLCLIVPHRTLEAVRPLLAQPRALGQFGGDPGWKDVLMQSLNHTPVVLTAVLHEMAVPLADVLGWQPGQVVDLGVDSTHEVTVCSSGKQMFRAAIGRRGNGAVALRVTTILQEQTTETEKTHGPAD